MIHLAGEELPENCRTEKGRQLPVGNVRWVGGRPFTFPKSHHGYRRNAPIEFANDLIRHLKSLGKPTSLEELCIELVEPASVAAK